jgi:hypothetical protein
MVERGDRPRGGGQCGHGADWRGHFTAQGLAGLADRSRSGRPAWFTPVQVARVKAIALTDDIDGGRGRLVVVTDSLQSDKVAAARATRSSAASLRPAIDQR